MDPNDKGIDYFVARFESVAKEAKEHGHASVIIIEKDDPISGTASVRTLTQGTPATVFGLLHMALKYLEKRFAP
jgi:hypothetical protein